MFLQTACMFCMLVSQKMSVNVTVSILRTIINFSSSDNSLENYFKVSKCHLDLFFHLWYSFFFVFIALLADASWFLWGCFWDSYCYTVTAFWSSYYYVVTAFWDSYYHIKDKKEFPYVLGTPVILKPAFLKPYCGASLLLSTVLIAFSTGTTKDLAAVA